MKTLFSTGGHVLMALAVVAAIATLVALGSVSAAVGVPVIIAAAGVSIGGAIARQPSSKPPTS